MKPDARPSHAAASGAAGLPFASRDPTSRGDAAAPAPWTGLPGPRRAPEPPDIELEPFTRAELCDLTIGEGLAAPRKGDHLARLGFHFATTPARI